MDEPLKREEWNWRFCARICWFLLTAKGGSIWKELVLLFTMALRSRSSQNWFFRYLHVKLHLCEKSTAYKQRRRACSSTWAKQTVQKIRTLNRRFLEILHICTSLVFLFIKHRILECTSQTNWEYSTTIFWKGINLKKHFLELLQSILVYISI